MSDNPMKILVVEDEPSLVFTLRDTLENEGYEVLVDEDGTEAVELTKEQHPDLLILDIMLPGKSGYDILQEIRKEKLTLPVIMLTAKDQEPDKVKGLNLGADDYLTKPFGVKELLARIEARLRRAGAYSSSREVEILQLGPVKIDLRESVVERPDNEEIELTSREVELIRYLLKSANEPVSRDELLEKVWRYEFSTNTRTVDVHISKLRAKIEMHPDDPRYLITLHGVGYMLRTD
ncbi:two-component system, OmpR family, response regulator VicR [Gracilimonas mengyeensis]|uniref:Two-component system, OmpR family, response regulator VicR n=2 Tax=Gracilimonas mengyeensis TaxID=1302730 RepID=A0A521CIV4_9BACT|nr:two-component system, OmpR family, response regulator VicR [Gracilimonas mengyeensis]